MTEINQQREYWALCWVTLIRNVVQFEVACKHCAAPWPTLSSWESGCSRLCCWMAIGGGRGTASAPSSPSSSPQLCMPDEEDLDRVPLLSPSLRIRWGGGVGRVRHAMRSIWRQNQHLQVLFPLVRSCSPPPGSRPAAWQRCRPSPSARHAWRPCSSGWRRGSSCACWRASWRVRLLCQSWACGRGWSTTSSACCPGAWGLVSCEGPGCGWSLAAGHHCWIQTRYLTGEERMGRLAFFFKYKNMTQSNQWSNQLGCFFEFQEQKVFLGTKETCLKTEFIQTASHVFSCYLLRL